MLPALTLAVLIRLIAPADATTLHGGATAAVEWRETAPLPHEVEEWEAFLSVDGGRYYALRITPHLDRDIRRITFTVPNVTSRDARILLRFGDEERETEVELPLRLKIEFDSLAPRPWPVVAETKGEPARERDEPVASWIAGERDGSHLRHLVQRSASCSSARLYALRTPHENGADEFEEDELDLPPCGIRDFVRETHRARIISTPREEQNPLLDTMRLNI